MDANRITQQSKRHSELGIAGMILGIISLLLSCIIIGGFFGIIGLILSIVGITQKNRKTGMAIAGIILNAIAVAIMILIFSLSASDDSNTEPSTSQATEGSIIIAQESTINESQSLPVKSEDSETPEETSAPAESKEDFIATCEEIPYKTLARYPEENVGKRIVLTVQISQIIQGDWFDDNLYYRVYTDSDGYGLYLSDEYFMYDSRVDDDTKLLEEDIIKVYGEFIGTESVTRALTGATEDVPAFKAYYIEILE